MMSQKKTNKSIIYTGHKFHTVIKNTNYRIQNTALLNVINHQKDTDKLFLYAKDPYEAKINTS